jgi:hypothetical protein
MDGPQQPTDARYSREEMDAILKRALERQQEKSDGISKDELIAAATEVGIPREEVEAAAREVDAQKAQAAEGEQARRASLAVVDENRAYAIRKFWRQAVTYGILTGFFFFFNLQTHATWWIWAALGMGLSLSMQATRIFFGEVRDVREQGLSRRERRRLRRQVRLGEFQARVEIGADAILRVVDEARKVKAQGGDPNRGGPRVVDAKVRVEPSDQRDEDEPESGDEKKSAQR